MVFDNINFKLSHFILIIFAQGSKYMVSKPLVHTEPGSRGNRKITIENNEINHGSGRSGGHQGVPKVFH